MPQKPPIMDGYIRVSRVNGREGDGFISPDVQREKIESWASLRGVEIADWHTDLDQSGGKLDRPGLTALLKRIKVSETEGVVVARLDRLSRLGVSDALKLVEQITEFGGSIAAVDLGIDPTTPFGEFGMTIMLALARMERRRLSDSWSEASGRAVQDGVHLSGTPPTGYLRENGKRSRLVLNPKVAPLVQACFLRRANGASPQELASFMQDNGVPMSASGIAGVLRNRVYLGEARGGPNGVIKTNAHDTIVSAQEWEAAQWRGRVHAKNGTIAAQGLLSGLITCAACGHKLGVLGTRNRSGGRDASYFCRTHYSAGKCSAPAAARARVVDGFVVQALAEAVTDGTLSSTLDAISRYQGAKQAVEKSEHDLRAIEQNTELVAALGVPGVAKLATKQREVLEEAKRVLRETPTPDDAIEPDQSFWFEPETWPMDEKRRLAKQLIAKITLRRSGKGRYGPPISERLEITWAGHDEPDRTIAERVRVTDSLPLPE